MPPVIDAIATIKMIQVMIKTGDAYSKVDMQVQESYKSYFDPVPHWGTSSNGKH